MATPPPETPPDSPPPLIQGPPVQMIQPVEVEPEPLLMPVPAPPAPPIAGGGFAPPPFMFYGPTGIYQSAPTKRKLDFKRGPPQEDEPDLPDPAPMPPSDSEDED